jgi:hypothetical protein
MMSPYSQHVIENIGGNLHLFVLFGFGFWVAIKNHIKNALASRVAVIAFSLLLLNIILSSICRARLDFYQLPGPDGTHFGEAIRFAVLSGLQFFSQLVGWICLIFALSKAFNPMPLNVIQAPQEGPL